MAHIDTLKTYEDLVQSGVDPIQAKAQVQILNSSFDGFATKEDLNNLESRLENNMKNLESKLENKMENLESRLENKMDLMESKLEAKLDSKFNILFTMGSIMFLINTKPIIDNIGSAQGVYLSYIAVVGLILWAVISTVKRRK